MCFRKVVQFEPCQKIRHHNVFSKDLKGKGGHHYVFSQFCTFRILPKSQTSHCVFERFYSSAPADKSEITAFKHMGSKKGLQHIASKQF